MERHLAGADGMFVDVESPIAAFLVEALGECEGHPDSAASDLEHEVLLLEAHVLDERAAAYANTAGTSALAAGGANLAEAQVLASLGRRDEIGDVVVTFAESSATLTGRHCS